MHTGANNEHGTMFILFYACLKNQQAR